MVPIMCLAPKQESYFNWTLFTPSNQDVQFDFNTISQIALFLKAQDLIDPGWPKPNHVKSNNINENRKLDLQFWNEFRYSKINYL